MRLLCVLALLTCLAGCRTETTTHAFLDAYRFFRPDQTAVKVTTELDPKFRYLRAQIGQRETFVALGYVDATPDGPVEVWYGPTGEVLRLRDGRVVGAHLEYWEGWQSVSFAGLPRWDEIGAAVSFERSRDARPGYRYGIKEKMHIRRIPAPVDTNLKLLSAAALTWFEERAEGSELPPTRYGVDLSGTKPRVVYAELCLARDNCFSWQRWLPKKASRQ